METVVIVFLLLLVAVQFVDKLKSIYKIGYYEKTLELNGFDITEVKYKSILTMIVE